MRDPRACTSGTSTASRLEVRVRSASGRCEGASCKKKKRDGDARPWASNECSEGRSRQMQHAGSCLLHEGQSVDCAQRHVDKVSLFVCGRERTTERAVGFAHAP